MGRIKQFVAEDRVYTDELRCFAWGTDAGFYRMTPQVVVRTKNENEVSELLAVASEMKLPVTFRAAGTSLSGQAISDSILVVAGKNWERYSNHAPTRNCRCRGESYFGSIRTKVCSRPCINKECNGGRNCDEQRLGNELWRVGK